MSASNLANFAVAVRSIPPLPALRLRLSFLPAPDPDPDHEEDDTNYNWNNCADRGAAPNRCAAPDGVMVGEGRGGGDQDYAGVDHQPAAAGNVGSEDGGQPALYAFFAHVKPLAGVTAV